jgi:hypothetical protein
MQVMTGFREQSLTFQMQMSLFSRNVPLRPIRSAEKKELQRLLRAVQLLEYQETFANLFYSRSLFFICAMHIIKHSKF